MRAFGTLTLAFVLSGIVGAVVQIQLGIALGAREELIVAMMILAAMTILTAIVMGLAMAASATVSGVNRAAAVLFAVPILIVLGFAAFVLAAPSYPISRDVGIVAEIEIPIAVMIAVQWWLVRRHWLKAHAA